MATTINLDTLKINYLTQAQYDTALNNNQINSNQLYFTPSSGDVVEQNNCTENHQYRILFSNSANDNNIAEVSQKNASLRFNPSVPRLFVSSHVEAGAIELYTQDGTADTNNGLTIDTHSATSYSSAWTPGTFKLQHWASSKGSGGNISSTNYVDSMLNMSTDSLYIRSYTGKETTKNLTSITDSALLMMTGNSWANATEGISMTNGGNITLKNEDSGITFSNTSGSMNNFRGWSKNLTSSSTETITLETNKIYLLIIKRMNNSVIERRKAIYYHHLNNSINLPYQKKVQVTSNNSSMRRKYKFPISSREFGKEIKLTNNLTVYNNNEDPRETLQDYVKQINYEIGRKRLEFGLPVD